MSDTPRTDAVMINGAIEAGAAWHEMRDLSRTLERELNMARKALLEAVAYVVHMPGVAVGDEYWTRRIEMAARWRKLAGMEESK